MPSRHEWHRMQAQKTLDYRMTAGVSLYARKGLRGLSCGASLPRLAPFCYSLTTQLIIPTRRATRQVISYSSGIQKSLTFLELYG